MPRTYDPDYHRRYAQSEKGRAARAKARARFIEKRRENNATPPPINPAPLAQALKGWMQ